MGGNNMGWKRYNKQTWGASDEMGIYCVHECKPGWWLAEFKPAGRDDVLDYGWHTSAKSGIELLDSIDEDKREVDNGQ